MCHVCVCLHKPQNPKYTKYAISRKIRYLHIMPRLDVRICEARNLADTQWISKPDPYVIVRLENQKHKTKSIENQLNPKWEEVFKFTVADENTSQIRFELWNKNVISDELMGVYSLSISGLKRGIVNDQWYLLQRCKSNAELRVRLCAVDFGLIPTAEEVAAAGTNGTSVTSSSVQPCATPQGKQNHQAMAGYPGQHATPVQPVYPPPVGTYPIHQGAYPQPQPGYPPQQPGYPPQQPGYPPQQPGYPPQ
eukprot:Tbor_TRINITY_DN5951_c1_g2::TRINITY_DN5951_c1_g2_i1::g.19005::m.19005